MKKQIEDLGSIEITDNDYGPCTVAVRLVDGNVWMTQSQIARLGGNKHGSHCKNRIL